MGRDLVSVTMLPPARNPSRWTSLVDFDRPIDISRIGVFTICINQEVQRFVANDNQGRGTPCENL